MSESYKTLPTVIEGTTGHSTKHATQQITNPNNLTSTNTALAFWGVQKPKYLGNYLRDWPDAISSKSGSYYTPEKIVAKGFSKSNDISDDGEIKSIKVIYKYGKISYSSKTAHGTFGKPTIILSNNNNQISSIKGNAPPADGIYNNKGENVNTRELTNTYTNTFDISASKLTMNDVKNLNITFANTSNTSSNHCRIVMQYIQLEIEYGDTPRFRTSIAYDGDKERALGEPVDVWVQVQGQNSISTNTECDIQIPSSVNVDKDNIDVNYGSLGTANTAVLYNNEADEIKTPHNVVRIDNAKNVIHWSINVLNNLNTGIDKKGNPLKQLTAKLFFTFIPQETGNQVVSSTLLKFADTVYYTDSRQFLIYKISKSESLILNVDSSLSNIGESNSFTIIYTTNAQSDGAIHIKTEEMRADSVKTPMKVTEWKVNDVVQALPSQENDTEHWYEYTNKATVTIVGKIDTTIAGTYKITVSKDNIIRTKQLTILPQSFDRNSVELSMEDGTAVEYNHIIFTKGDDLERPLIFTQLEPLNSPLNDLTIKGINTHIPLEQTQYVTFEVSMDIDEQRTYDNILFEPQIINGTENDIDILVGCNPSCQIINSKYILLDSISTGEVKKVKLAVCSDIAKVDNMKLLLYGESERKVNNKIETFSTPATVTFKDIPTLRLNISNKDDLHDITYTLDEYTDDIIYPSFTLLYSVHNISNLTADIVNIKITESNFFNITYPSDLTHEFDKNKNVWNIKNLQPNEIKTIAIQYTPTKKGLYQFIMETVDDINLVTDDVYKNKFAYDIAVDMEPITNITTSVSNTRPTVDDFIEYSITVENNLKTRDKLVIDLFDVGQFEDFHMTNHYNLESIDLEYGTFDKADSGNKIGTWTLYNLGIGQTYFLNLTLRPFNTSAHNIQLKANSLDVVKTNIVNVIERKSKIDFDVYQGIDLRDDKTFPASCSDYTKFCDNDFLSLGDEYGYVITVNNNNKNDEDDYGNIYVEAILPPELEYSIVDRHIECENGHIIVNNDNDKCNIVGCNSTNTFCTEMNYKIENLKACESTTKCFAIKPKYEGTFTALFVLYGDNINVTTKTLTITVNDIYPEYKLEHFVNIYNFERLNQYYTFELNGDGTDLVKKFHKGDRSIKMIQDNPYDVKALESYTGANLKELCTKLENSRYIKPTYLRNGNNALYNAAYQLYPDGFIRRFGLMPSEIYHNTGVLPTTKDMADLGMKWAMETKCEQNMDTWNSKVWSGDLWDSGVFKLTIDYDKVPSNFSTIDLETLQIIVDRTKPFGMKGITYYSDTERFNASVNFEISNKIINNIKMPVSISDFGTISQYTHADGRLSIYNSTTNFKLHNPNMKLGINSIDNPTYKVNDKDAMNLKANLDVQAIYLAEEYSLHTIRDYNSIFEFNDLSNFDITKPITTVSQDDALNSIFILSECSNDLSSTQTKTMIAKDIEEDYQYLYYFDNDVINNTEFGLYIKGQNDYITVSRCKDIVHNIDGFKYTINGETERIINLTDKIYTFKILVQRSARDYLHFYYVVNGQKVAHHIGCYKDYQTLDTQIVYALKNKNIDNEIIYSCKDKQTLGIDENITISLSNNYNVNNSYSDSVLQIKDDIKWQNLSNINNNNQTFALCKYDINKDKECIKAGSKRYSSPVIACFDNIDIDDDAEIQSIDLKIKAQSNKGDFLNDIDASVLLNGKSYIPDNGGNKIIYPSETTNIAKTYNPVIDINATNITSCNNCGSELVGIYDKCPICNSTDLHIAVDKYTTCHYCGMSSKGQYSQCPQCGSKDVTYDSITKTTTYCNNCYKLFDGYYTICPYCNSKDIEVIEGTNNVTVCDNCGRISAGHYKNCPFCASSKVYYLNNLNAKEYVDKVYDEKKKYDFGDIYFNTNIDKLDLFDLIIRMNDKTQDIDKLEELILHIKGTNNKEYGFFVCENCHNIGQGTITQCPYCGSTLVDNYGSDNLKLIGYSLYQGATSKINLDATIPQGEFDIPIDILPLIKQNKNSFFTIRLFAENRYNDTLVKTINDLDILLEDKENLINSLNTIDIKITDIESKNKYIENDLWDNINGLIDKNQNPLSYTVPYNKTYTESFNLSGFDFNDIKSVDKNIINIKGISYADTEITLKLKCSSDKYETDYVTITDITPGTFDIQYNINDLVIPEMLNDEFNISFYFSDIPSLTKVKILDMFLDIDYNKEIISLPPIEHNVYTKMEDNLYCLLSSNNLWGLKEKSPKQINGYNLNNRILGIIDFNYIDYNEYIKLYSIELIVKYIDKNYKLITDVISSNHDSDKINIKNSIINLYNGERTNDYTVDMFEKMSNPYGNSIINDSKVSVDVNDEYLNYIELHDGLYQAFTPKSTVIDGIGLNVLSKIGYPHNRIKLCIYDDKNGEPDNLIRSRYIDGWGYQTKELINYDLFVTGLNVTDQYWLGLELPEYDEYNYYTLGFNNNKHIGKLLKKENNNKYQDISNLCLSFNCYSPQYTYIAHNPQLQSGNNFSVALDGTDDFNIEYDFYRQNLNQNIEISNLKVDRGKDYSKNYNTSVFVKDIEAQVGDTCKFEAWLMADDIALGTLKFWINDIPIEPEYTLTTETDLVSGQIANHGIIEYTLPTEYNKINYDYNIKVEYIPEGNIYKSSTGYGTLTITSYKKPKIQLIGATSTNDSSLKLSNAKYYIEPFYKEKVTILYQVLDENNAPLTNGYIYTELRDSLNGNIIKKDDSGYIKVDSDGKASVTYDTKDIIPSEDRFVVYAEYDPRSLSSSYSKANAPQLYINSKKLNTDIKVNSNEFSAYSSDKLKISLLEKDSTINYITNDTVNVYYYKEGAEDKKQSVLIKDGYIDELFNGIYCLILNLSAGNWIFNIKFGGNNYYNSNQIETNINILPIPAFLNRDDGSMRVRLELKAGSNVSALAGQTITMYNDDKSIQYSVNTVLEGTYGVADFTQYKTEAFNTHVLYEYVGTDFKVDDKLDGYM